MGVWDYDKYIFLDLICKVLLGIESNRYTDQNLDRVEKRDENQQGLVHRDENEHRV